MTMNQPWVYVTQAQIGMELQLAPEEFTPENAADRMVKRWESTNPATAVTDDSGHVKITGNGLAQIRAYSADESCYASCDIFVRPPKVSGFRAETVNKNNLKLTWDAVDTCYGYYIYQWDAAASAWKLLTDRYLDPDVTSYRVGNLNADTSYQFCIRAFYSNWLTGQRQLYESEDSVLTVKTYAYQPVTSITGNEPVFTVLDTGGRKEGDIYHNLRAQYEHLSQSGFFL